MGFVGICYPSVTELLQKTIIIVLFINLNETYGTIKTMGFPSNNKYFEIPFRCYMIITTLILIVAELTEGLRIVIFGYKHGIPIMVRFIYFGALCVFFPCNHTFNVLELQKRKLSKHMQY